MSGKADLNIRGVVWAIDTGALHLQVDYSVGLVSVKAQEHGEIKARGREK